MTYLPQLTEVFRVGFQAPGQKEIVLGGQDFLGGRKDIGQEIDLGPGVSLTGHPDVDQDESKRLERVGAADPELSTSGLHGSRLSGSLIV